MSQIYYPIDYPFLNVYRLEISFHDRFYEFDDVIKLKRPLSINL